jgi:outer membrane protein TolC
VTNQELNALLGLSPQAKLDLVGPSTIHTLNDTDVRRDLADLPRRRPDLLALEAGYRSQDERYRQAILRQFPSIDIGFDRSRDTSNVNTYGFDISISLPIFNRHRGVVAVEKATRQRLHDEYSARLFSARAEINRIQLDQTILERRRHQLEHVNATMSQTSQAAEAAHARGDLSDIAYLSRQAAWLDNSLALLGVNRYIQEQQVALRILVGSQPQTD